MAEWVKVTKEEFNRFISEYPVQLDRNVAHFCMPSVVNYNDFSNDKVWPESMVATIHLFEELKGASFYKGELNEYRILR